MKSKILRALRFLRVTDECNNISLTNVVLMVVIVAMIRRPELASMDAVALFTAVASYQVKRFKQPATEDASGLKAAVESLQTKVTALQMGNKYQR